MNIEHIHRIAAHITESPDEYEGLEDSDVFSMTPNYGYGCGRGCWEYENININIKGQMLPATAKVKYDFNVWGTYFPGDLENPPEYPDLEISDEYVESFEIWNPAATTTLYKWDFLPGNPGFQPEGGVLDDATLQNVLSQILNVFNSDEQRVLEYENEHYDDDYDPSDYDD